jgi:ADP-ribose pyrophosphatase YjhB (NUDIX family)
MDALWRRAATYVVCRDADDRLLLTRFVEAGNPESGAWTMPGGGMEWGEHPVDTAVRELEEETGLCGRVGSVLGVFSLWLDGDEANSGTPGHVLAPIFEVTNLTGELRTTFEEGTTDAAAWFTIEEVRSLRRVSLVDFVLDLLAQ